MRVDILGKQVPPSDKLMNNETCHKHYFKLHMPVGAGLSNKDTYLAIKPSRALGDDSSKPRYILHGFCQIPRSTIISLSLQN